jgi:hypothetical protein
MEAVSRLQWHTDFMFGREYYRVTVDVKVMLVIGENYVKETMIKLHLIWLKWLTLKDRCTGVVCDLLNIPFQTLVL